MSTTCENCNGQGSIITSADACRICHGGGVVEERRSVKVEIPAGVEDGMRLRVAGEGHAPSIVDFIGESKSRRPKTARGDVIVQIRVLPHSSFSRKGSDVLYTASIPLTSAILGGKIKIPTLDDKEVEVPVPTGTNTGDRISMPGMGMPPIGGSLRARKGDFKVEFKVQMPKALTASQRILVELLADEFRDKGAKRIMGVGMDQVEKKGSDAPRYVSEEDSGTSTTGETKRHDGFLKNLFTKLTHPHHQPKKPLEEEKDSNSSGCSGATDEGRKASGSGS